jgi:AcrR family transcriptional regulator
MENIMESKEDLKQRREKQIYKAALKVFSKYGYYKADVDLIARKAKIGKGTVYRYSKNKKNLFVSLVGWGLAQLKDEILTNIEEIDDEIEKINTVLEVYFSFYKKNNGFYRVLIYEKFNFMDEIAKKFKIEHFAHLHIIESILQQGIKRGVFKNIDTRNASIALIGMTDALLFKWLFENKKTCFENELSTLKELFFNGILVKEKK